jgi:hypothetical protein
MEMVGLEANCCRRDEFGGVHSAALGCSLSLFE